MFSHEYDFLHCVPHKVFEPAYESLVLKHCQITEKCMGESLQDYSSIQDFEADFILSIESQPQNPELGRL